MTIFEKASFPALPYAANAGIPSAPAELSTKVNGRNTGIYYTFMGAASYLIPVVAAQLTKSSGEASAVYSLMIMLLVFAILAILSSLYLVAQHKKIFGKSAL